MLLLSLRATTETTRFFFTVLPPLALSTIVSFQPQKGFYRTPTTTRSQGK